MRLWKTKAYHGKSLMAIGYYRTQSRADARSAMWNDCTHIVDCRITATPATDHVEQIDARPAKFALIRGQAYGLKSSNRWRVRIRVDRLHVSTSWRAVVRSLYRALPGPFKADRRDRALIHAMMRYGLYCHRQNRAVFAAVNAGV